MRVPKFRLFLVILLAAGVVLGWLGMLRLPIKDAWTDFWRDTDTSIIDSYDVKYSLAANGDLRIDEKIAVQFTEAGKHGIFRIFDTADSQYASIEHPVEVESVERKVDGEWVYEPWIISQSGDGTMTIRIGDAGVTLPQDSIQRYRIVSTTTDAITHNKAGSQWYWDVVGSGWMMPMRQVSVKATLPPTTGTPACEASVPCEVVKDGDAWSITQSDLEPYTPITMKALFATPVPAPPTNWFGYWRVGLALLLAALSLLFTLATFARSRERPASPQPRFEPPGPDPLVCSWLLEESSATHLLPTVLLNLVSHDVVTFSAEQSTLVDSDGPDWISLRRTEAPVPPLVGMEQAVASLGLTYPGAVCTISKDSVSDGKMLKELSAAVDNEIEPAVQTAGLAQNVNGSCMALFLAWLVTVGGLTALIWFQQALLVATVALVPAAVGLLINSRDQHRLTAAGADLRDATEGFKQVLSTKASVERFDYAARVRHFDEYLPWAVAFDCADEWAASCTPPPGYEQSPGYHGFYTPVATSQMWAFSNSISSVEASAVSAYQATQSSSSGGGGGGGGGGGSGGGGGGSW